MAAIFLALALLAARPAGAFESSSPNFTNQSLGSSGEPRRVQAPPGSGHAGSGRFSSVLRPARRRSPGGAWRPAVLPPSGRAGAVRPAPAGRDGGAAGRGRTAGYAAAALIAAFAAGLAAVWARRSSRRDQPSPAESESLAFVAHELKSPVAAIESYLELMEAEGAAGGSRRARRRLEDLRRMKSTTAHMRRTIEDLLQVTRIESGSMRVLPGPADLSLLASEAAESFRGLAEKAGLSLSVSAGPGDCMALADPARTRQVLDNLISNAVKFTRRGGRVEVRVAASGAAGTVECSVSDTGPGLAPGQAGRLFCKFARLRPSASGEEGTGLGLFIAKAIVEAHGGAIKVLTSPEAGSTFSFTLPAAGGRGGQEGMGTRGGRLP